MTVLRNRKIYNYVEKKYLYDDGGSVNQEKKTTVWRLLKGTKLLCYLIPLCYFYVCMFVYIKRSKINIPKDISVTAKFIITPIIVAKIQHHPGCTAME